MKKHAAYRGFIPRRLPRNPPVQEVAGFTWNGWQLSSGMGGRLAVESVAGLGWNTQQLFEHVVATVNDRFQENFPE
jgi:hypothetical protein